MLYRKHLQDIPIMTDLKRRNNVQRSFWCETVRFFIFPANSSLLQKAVPVRSDKRNVCLRPARALCTGQMKFDSGPTNARLHPAGFSAILVARKGGMPNVCIHRR